jgi:diguanylate cyclase (GGDEF)-like protein/PAS domain S-box-containing protein
MLQGVAQRQQIGSSPAVLAQVGLVAVLLPALLSASLSLPLLMLTSAGLPGMSVTVIWLNQALGGVIGSLVMLPLLLAALAQPWPSPTPEHPDRRRSNADTLVLMLAGAGVTVLALLHLVHPFVYIALPLMIGAVLLDFLRLQLLVLGVTLVFGAMVATGLVAEPPTTARWQGVLLHLSLVVMLLPELLLSAAVGASRERRLALEAQRERYRHLYERTPAMMHSIGPDGRMLAVSRLWLERLGYDERDVIGRPSTDFLDAESRRRAIEQVLPQFLRTGECRDVEYRMLARDGRPVDVLLSAISERDAQGRFLRSLAVLEDVTRKRLAEQLAAEHQRTAAMLECIGDAVIGIDARGRIRSLNPAAVAMTGWMLEEARGRDWAGWLSRRGVADDEPVPPDPVAFCLAHRTRPEPTSCRLVRRDASWRVVREIVLPMSAPGGQGFDGVVLTLQDMTAAHDLARTLAHRAHHDALTGLPNRLLLQDRLQQALRLARRQHQPLALMFMDLDHFKQINDRHGHDAGDELLKAVAQRVRGAVRASDTVCRLGGDEFVVLLPQVEAALDAERVARHILSEVSRPYRLGALPELQVSFSIGIAVFPEDGEDEATLMRRADTAMYQAKREGRNALRFHHRGDTDLTPP